MQIEAIIGARAELSAKVIHKDGSTEDLGVLKRSPWRRVVDWLRSRVALLALLIFLMLPGGAGLGAAFVVFGIVTTAGVNYMASDFASGGVTPTISGFKFHGVGVGTVGAVVGDTDLGTPALPSRVSGTPTNPTANQYRSIATIAFTTTLAITEWGLFSVAGSGNPPSGGTLWDRRVFAAINVVDGDSIQFTYTLTVNSGGT